MLSDARHSGGRREAEGKQSGGMTEAEGLWGGGIVMLFRFYSVLCSDISAIVELSTPFVC